MGEKTAIDQFYNQQLDEYLESEEYICPIIDYKSETLDAAWESVYQLESNNTAYVFSKKDSVEFFDWLKSQYKDILALLKDFSLDINDLVFAIKDDEFSTDGTMDFLLFLGAEKVEAKRWISKNTNGTPYGVCSRANKKAEPGTHKFNLFKNNRYP